MNLDISGKNALILGCSSGFGAATCLELAKQGVNIYGVHLDRKSTMDSVNSLVDELTKTGVNVEFFNLNAADLTKIEQVCEGLKKAESSIDFLMHSLAFGSLKTFTGESRITKSQLDMTVDVMANSLVYWVQKLIELEIFNNCGRIFAMTSIGSSRIWKSYGAVSAAKSALESHCRQLAVELADKGITSNSILAGVTDTAALKKIPGSEKMVEWAKSTNPYKRLTVTSDVAKTICGLCSSHFNFVTGNVIYVDGGEAIVG